MKFCQLLEIKDKLSYGDYITIKDIVGCSLVAVRSHFSGARNHNSPTGKRITEVAIKLIESRERIASEMKNPEDHV
jgi:hypothetical protein